MVHWEQVSHNRRARPTHLQHHANIEALEGLHAQLTALRSTRQGGGNEGGHQGGAARGLRAVYLDRLSQVACFLILRPSRMTSHSDTSIDALLQPRR